jgi:hypothetical protein
MRVSGSMATWSDKMEAHGLINGRIKSTCVLTLNTIQKPISPEYLKHG